MYRKRILKKVISSSFLLFFAISLGAYAQNNENVVKGKVVEEGTGDPLPGTTIMQKGTSNGAVTDANGNYTVTLSEKGEAVLSFSFIGYKTQEVPVNGRSTIDVQLQVDISTMDELVVVGYGSVKKEDATGAVAVMDAEDFNKGAINTPQELISGKTAGVSISSNSGAPGNASTIRIRGGASLSASNDPLIVIDGVPIDNTMMGGSSNILSTLNPNDIASFTVLKDASSTAIYGSRASNGVILITTKRGERGLKVTYNAVASVYTVPKTMDVYSGDEYRALIGDLYEGNEEVLALLGDADTNWQDEIYRTAFGMDHNLSVSGAFREVPYRVSVGYNNTDGILKTYNFEKTTVSLNLDPYFFDDHLQVKINVKGMDNNNNFAEQGAIANAIYYDPTKPVLNGNTRWRGYTTWTTGGANGNAIDLATPNPVAQLELTDNTSNVKRSIGNAQFDYSFHFLPELRANLNLGYDYAESVGHNNVKDNTQWVYIPTPAGGRISRYAGKSQNELLDFYFNYRTDLEELDSKIDATAGYSWSHFKRMGEDSVMNQYMEQVTYNDYANEYYLVSFFGRLNYTWKDKYLLTLSLRNDATSRFSPEQRWGLFPAAALAWDIDEEDFLKDNKAISNLKLRLGYGITGQQDITGGNNYPYFAKFTISNETARYRFGDNYYYTLRPDGYDANIKWETTVTSNIGVDYGFFEDRISGSLDFYYRDTRDLLSTVDVATGTNFSARVLTNVGSMVNKGIELNINGVLASSQDFEWNLGYNVSYNNNEITKLNLNNDPDYIVPVGGIAGTTSGTIQVQKVNYPVNSFYVYEQVYDAEGNPLEGVYVDRDNNNVINSEDLYVSEKPNADVLMGINSGMRYKNWDFSFAGRASLGNYVYNNVAANSTYQGLYSSMGFLTNASTQADKTKFETAIGTNLSDFYIENGSFFRMDNINLGYRFQNLLGSKLNLRVSGGVQNAFVITNYSGLDPEINGGLDNNFFPRARVFLLGVNCEF
jgi:TonB-linked SusC/RagA family outer membrane protein